MAYCSPSKQPVSPPVPVDNRYIQHQMDLCERKARDSRITAFALTIITVVLMAISFALFGAATLSPELTMGLGIFPYLSGTFLGAVSIGVFAGALVHLVIASIRDSQRETWEGELLNQ